MTELETELAFLRFECGRYDLAGREILDRYTDAELSTIYNGAGPDSWKPIARQILTELMKLFKPEILLHDVQFEESDGTRETFELVTETLETELQEDFRHGISLLDLAPAIPPVSDRTCVLVECDAGGQSGRFRRRSLLRMDGGISTEGGKMTFNERLSKLENQTEENGKTIWRVFEAIYGNGKPGLLSEFRLLRESVEQHHNDVKEEKRSSKLDWQWVITTMVAIGAIVVAIFK